ncbi:hypothetical protein DIPPA_35223 [Diplonema papillatum]|nr:hypothetical protein DIPPA_35223 [Diplonema papillatum]
MPMFSKLLHTALYLKLKPLVREHILRGNFQYGCGRASGAAQVILFAKEWLESDPSDDDDENVLLLVDVLSAYDTVPHGKLVECVERLLGRQWAETVARVIEGQSVTIVHYEGFATPVRLKRGLLQGSSLSVLLFLLYTCEPPNGETVRAYVDDVVARTTKSKVDRTFGNLRSWARSRELDLADEKVVVVAKSEFEWGENPSRKTTDAAVLLGACVHAREVDGHCTNDSEKGERFARLIDFVNSHHFRSTRRKCALVRSHVLPTLAVHCLSSCFDSKSPKLVANMLKLIPKHRHSKGLSGFATCKEGFGSTTVERLMHLQRTRAHLAYHCNVVHDRLPMPGFLRRPPRGGAPGEEVLRRVELAVRSEWDGVATLVVATDGGFLEGEARGSAGVAVGQAVVGCAMAGSVTSSTEAELCAMLVLAAALCRCDVPPRAVEWRCDSQAAITRAQRNADDDPVARIVGPFGQCMRWHRGHAGDAYIDRADQAASEALLTRDPLLDVELVYREGGIPTLCVHEREALPQLDTPVRFVKRAVLHLESKAVLKKIREVASHTATRGATLQALERVPGAVDLFQAIVRRAVMPNRTRVTCRLCQHAATAQHVLLGDDAIHNAASSAPEAYPQGLPSLRGVLEDFALRRPPALKFFAERVKSTYDDPLTNRWTAAILNYLR